MDYFAVAIAVTSLVLTFYLQVRQHLARREASLEVRLEEFYGEWTRGSLRKLRRLVLVNHGPSVARQVNVELLTPDREPWPGGVMNDHLVPVPRVHPGQDFHLEVVLPLGAYLPALARLSWADGRRGTQELEVWLSSRLVP